MRDLRDDIGGGGDILGQLVEVILERAVDGLLIHILAKKVPISHNLVHRALDLTDVGRDVFGNELGDIVVDSGAPLGSLVFDNGEAGFKVGRLHVHKQTPFKARAQPVVQQRHVRRRTIRGQHDLAAVFVEGVEGIEQLVLHLLLARHDLHIVHQQQIRVAILRTELAAAAGADQLDELADEIVALDVDDLGLRQALAELMGNGVDQMGFAEAGVAVDEQGIIVRACPVSHGAGGGIGHFVRLAHHEGVEREFAGLQQRGRTFGLVAFQGAALRRGEELDLKIRGIDILQCAFDLREEE